MKFSIRELTHIQRVLASDIDECTNLLEGEIPDERVAAIVSRMEGNRNLLEKIDRERHARVEGKQGWT